MKKIVFMLAMLVFAAPVWATVEITCSVGPDSNEFVISYDATTELTDLPRAFALDIRLDTDANIVEVTPLSPDYIIYPGSIVIDAGGNVTDYGSIACSPSYPGTLTGMDSNAVTIECGSLYAPTGPGSPNAPDLSGPLVSVKVSGEASCITISGNVVRAGSTGVVMEDPNQEPTVIFYDCCWEPPDCTSPLNCAGHAQGDATCDGSVNLGDLIALKAAWGQTGPPWAGAACCADFDNSGAVNLGDLIALKAGWGTTGHSPSTLNQNCR